MKPSLIALFTLFAFIASSAKAFVVDIKLEPVINGGTYYIHPFTNLLGGGLTLDKTGNETCPLTVKPDPFRPSQIGRGLPWRISSPVKSLFLPTHVLTDFFTVDDERRPSCVPFPSKWTIVEEEDGVKSVKVSGHYENTITGVFRIKRYTKFTYKIVFCPTDSDCCKAIGLSSRGLVLTDGVPMGVIFAKVESPPEVSEQLINNVLEA